MITEKYHIGSKDNFHASNFPQMINELDVLQQVISESPSAYKKEILVSFLKKQSMEDDWINANPEFVTLISSGIFQTDHLESLFDSCRQNGEFRRQYEEFINKRIS